MHLAALVLLAQTQTITFTEPVMPLRDLIPKLAEKTGEKMAVAKELEWQILYVRVKDVPVSDLLPKIEKAAYGRFNRDANGILVLGFDRTRYATFLAERKKARRAWIAKALGAKAAVQSDPGAEREMPMVIAGMLASIGVDTLANLSTDKRAVYSNLPTRMQRLLPRVDARWMEELVLSENRRRSLRAARPAAVKTPEVEKAEKLLDPAYWAAKQVVGKGMYGKEPMTWNPPYKLDLSLSPGETWISCELTMSDGSGVVQHMETGELTAVEETDDRSFEDYMDAQREQDKGPTAEVTAATAALFDFWLDDEVNDVTRTRILDFRKKDPFLEAYSEFAAIYASGTEDNLVLPISDEELFGMGRKLARKRVEVWMRGELEIDKKDGWQVGYSFDRPDIPDRGDIAALIDRFRDKRTVDLDDIAWVAANIFGSDSDSWNNLADWVLFALHLETFSFESPLLKAYSRLPEGDKSRLKSGGSVQFSAMPPEARRILEDFAFEPYFMERLEPLPKQEPLDYIQRAERSASILSREPTVFDESTNSLPNGIPGDATLSLSLEDSVVYLPAKDSVWPETKEGVLEGNLVNAYVQALLSDENPIGNPSVIISKKQTAMFTFQTPSRYGFREVHGFPRPDKSDRTVKMSELGEGFQKVLAEKLEKAKQWKAYQKALSADRARKSAPPPVL